jgi:hypothetical protein
LQFDLDFAHSATGANFGLFDQQPHHPHSLLRPHHFPHLIELGEGGGNSFGGKAIRP